MPAYAISLTTHLTINTSGIGDRFPSYASGLRAVYCHLYTRQSMRCVSRNICSLFGYGDITGYTPWLRFSVRNGDKVPDSQHFETNLEGLVQNVDVVGVLTTVTANGSELAPFTANFTSTERGVK